MVLFNKFVTCALDTNVHGAFPDWYDGGKTTLTLGGDTESCALLKCDYSQSPNYGSGELHSAKLLIYPTSTSKTRAYIEPSRFKVYKVNRQLENEGSLDAVTTDLIIGASHQPNDGVTFYEETFTGRDIDGDGIPDKGESVTFTAYERIVFGTTLL
jgi:hypothetical protein